MFIRLDFCICRKRPKLKFFGRFCYNFDDKFYYELGLANIKLNKEQKHNVKLACGLIRDSLWEPEINEIKNCVEKFSDYHKQANGKLIAKPSDV